MKEELLVKIREDLEIEKKRLKEYNDKIKRIKELMKDEKVKEFLDLTSLDYKVGNSNKMVTDDIIASIYSKYLYIIRESDTNGLYVYLGTYAYNDEMDIVHGSRDYRVSYDSPKADYRLYQNIELWGSEHILIRKCEEFEKTHTIINPNVPFSDKAFYEIQKDFFIRAVKDNQESAKRMVLRKYSK